MPNANHEPRTTHHDASRTTHHTPRTTQDTSRTPPPALTIAIAGLSVSVTCNDPAVVAKLQRRYRAYAAEGDVQLTAAVHLAGHQRQSALLDTGTVFREGVLQFTAAGYAGFIDEEAGEATLNLSSAQPAEEIDYFLRVVYALLAFHAGGLLIHAAGIVRDGRAYAFFGHSGSGKTTVARLSPAGQVLNDDLLVLMPTGDGWTACSTPFWNPSQVAPAGPRQAPLSALFQLVQDRAVYVEEMEPSQALAELVSSVPVISASPTRSGRLLARGQQILQAVPAHRLHFLPDASFWQVIPTP